MASALRHEPSIAPRQPRIDERFLECTLEVNPQLRAGRSTAEVKAQLLAEARARHASTTPTGAPALDLSVIVDGFLQSQMQGFEQAKSDIAQRHAALDAELQAHQAALFQKVQTFLRMLDANTLKAIGPNALAKHRKLLAELKVSASQLFDQAFGK